MKSTSKLVLLLALSAGMLRAQAQTYPTRPVRFIISFPPGGPTDIIGRMATDALSRSWGVQVLPDNRAGAGGNLGQELCAKSKPDGYTICMFTLAHSVAPSIYTELKYDALKDFVHVSLLAALPNMLHTHPSLPVKTVQDLVKLAKARPGAMFYASAGNGTSPHMMMEQFKMLAGINIVHVPYKGPEVFLIDQIAGRVEVGFTTAIVVLPYAQRGKLRGLAVSTRERLPAVPELPTMEQAGVKGFDGSAWNAVVMPAGTPREIVAKVSEVLIKMMHALETKGRITAMGGIAIGSTPEEFLAYLKTDMARWASVAKAAKIKID